MFSEAFFFNVLKQVYMEESVNDVCSKKISKVTARRMIQACNSFPNGKILDFTKLKAFADKKLNVAKMTNSVFIRRHWGKSRKCWLAAFSPFPTVFSKAFFCRVVKSRHCVVMG